MTAVHPGTPEPARPKGERTEWVTRKFDADGTLVSEKITTETVIDYKAGAQPELGGYL